MAAKKSDSKIANFFTNPLNAALSVAIFTVLGSVVASGHITSFTIPLGVASFAAAYLGELYWLKAKQQKKTKKTSGYLLIGFSLLIFFLLYTYNFVAPGSDISVYISGIFLGSIFLIAGVSTLARS